MLDKFSKEKVPPGVAIGIPGEYFNLGSENGRWIDGTVDLAKFLVQQGSAVVKGSVANWNHVAITLSAQERGDLVQELLDLEKFKGFKEGVATLFALAGFGMGVLAGSNKGDHQLRVSSGAFPAVARAVAGLGKML